MQAEKKRLTKKEKREERWQRIKERHKEKSALKKRTKKKYPPADQLPPKYKVAIEVVGGTSLMSEKEMKSLALQIRYAYASNRVSPAPVSLFLTNTPLISQWLVKEHTSWKNFSCVQESIKEWKISPVVVLTADSDNVLDKMDPDTIYVVGGLVDRNREKRYVENQFKEIFPTARLPLPTTLTSSRVLSTLHVVNILLSFAETQDWEVSINKHLPERKTQ